MENFINLVATAESIGDSGITINGFLFICGAIVTIASVVGIGAGVYKAFKSLVHKLSLDDLEEKIKPIIDDSLKPVLTAIITISEEVDKLKSDMNTTNKEITNDLIVFKKTLQDIVRNDIVKIHKECIKADYIGEHTMYVVSQLFTDYEKLEGNKFVKDLVDDLQELYSKCHKSKKD